MPKAVLLPWFLRKIPMPYILSSIQYSKGLSHFQFSAIPSWSDTGTFDQEEWVLVAHDKQEVRSLMTDYVGIVRSNLGLQRALGRNFTDRWRSWRFSQTNENYWRAVRASKPGSGCSAHCSMRTLAQRKPGSAFYDRLPGYGWWTLEKRYPHSK